MRGREKLVLQFHGLQCRMPNKTQNDPTPQDGDDEKDPSPQERDGMVDPPAPEPGEERSIKEPPGDAPDKIKAGRSP